MVAAPNKRGHLLYQACGVLFLRCAMLSPMHRIYFDGNDGPDNDRYGLWLAKSREDLAKIPGGPHDGLIVTIYMTGEIEMEATLEWDAGFQAWTARPIAGTTRDNHESWD
jgi:hypothetical protein